MGASLAKGALLGEQDLSCESGKKSPGLAGFCPSAFDVSKQYWWPLAHI